MAEIENPESAYVKIAQLAHDGNIEVIAVGTDGYGSPAVSIDQAIERINQFDDSSAVLIKGSRVAGLERVVDAVVPN
jgi:UDP-N-acetylmuramyl pentapeptide synthase